MTQATDRDRQLRHAGDRWTDVFTDWQKIAAGVAVLAKHRPVTSNEALVNASMEVLGDESRWTEIHPGRTEIHPDATFATVRSATLRAGADRDTTSAAVFLALENLLRRPTTRRGGRACFRHSAPMCATRSSLACDT